MRKLVIILLFVAPFLVDAQSSKDLNIIVQKTLDLHALKSFYNDTEKKGETPIIIINNGKVPENLIVFKFNKRVKILTHEEIEQFKTFYNGNLDSYFIFEVLDLTDDNVVVEATFRKNDNIPVHVSMKKVENNWKVTESKAG